MTTPDHSAPGQDEATDMALEQEREANRLFAQHEARRSAPAMGEVTEEIWEAFRQGFWMSGSDRVGLEAAAKLIAQRERARGMEEAKKLILNGRFLTEDAPIHKWAKEVAAMLDRHLAALSPSPPMPEKDS